MALLAQAALHQLRRRLANPFSDWDAAHLAKSLLAGLEGDVRVHDDTIVVTYYNAPNVEQLRQHYEGLPDRLDSEHVDPAHPLVVRLQARLPLPLILRRSPINSAEKMPADGAKGDSPRCQPWENQEPPTKPRRGEKKPPPTPRATPRSKRSNDADSPRVPTANRLLPTTSRLNCHGIWTGRRLGRASGEPV